MPAKWDITICRGSSFILYFKWLDTAGAAVDLTGYTASMDIRKTKDDSDYVLSSEDGDIILTLGDSAGTVLAEIIPAVTEAISLIRGVYDVEVTNTATGIKTRLIEGEVTLSLDVTREDS